MLEDFATGVFLIPAEHVSELEELVKQEDEAQRQDYRDLDMEGYLGTQFFLRSRERARASVVIDGYISWKSVVALAGWLRWCVFDGAEYTLFDGPVLRQLDETLADVKFKDFHRWVKRRKRTYADHDLDQLRTLFEGLKELAAAARAGGQGLTLAMFSPRDVDPPDYSVPEGPSLAPEDNAQLTRNWQRLDRINKTRSLDDYWYEWPIDGRVLLGLLPPEAGPMWRERWEEINALYRDSRYLAIWQQYAQFVFDLEPVIYDAEILAESGRVEVHATLMFRVQRPLEHKLCDDIIAPEQQPLVLQRFAEMEAAEGGRRALLRDIWQKHAYWPLALVRAEYQRIRELVATAHKRGYWLVWMHDKYTETVEPPASAMQGR